MDKKKLTIIAISVLAIIAVAILAYFIFKKDDVTPNNTPDSPFGSASGSLSDGVVNQFSEPQTQNTQVQTVESKGPDLWKVFPDPVSGATIIDRASSSKIRFIEKATGHYYESNLDDRSVSRITNSTIPKIEEVYFEKSGDFLAARFVKDGAIQTFYAALGTSTASSTDGFGKLDGSYLTPNLLNFAISPTNKIFYTQNIGEKLSGSVIARRGDKPVTIWNSSLINWLVEWPNDNAITLTTKPGHGEAGVALLLDAKSGALTKVLDGKGLTTRFSPSLNFVLFSTSENRGLELAVFDRKSKTTTNISPATLPEKCVWNKQKESVIYCGAQESFVLGNYPDNWYQGLIFFSDSVWKHDMLTGESKKVSDLSSISGQEIDVFEPFINSRGDLLIFRNKIDYSLWALKISN